MRETAKHERGLSVRETAKHKRELSMRDSQRRLRVRDGELSVREKAKIYDGKRTISKRFCTSTLFLVCARA